MDEEIALHDIVVTDRGGVHRYRTWVTRHLSDRRRLMTCAIGLLEANSLEIAKVAEQIVHTLRRGQRVLVAGNGGSATEAQHFASELIGRFQREREPYAVLALTADSAILTAIANDYGYRQVFARQVSGLGQPGDLLLLYSTSGRSENVLAAAQVARQIGMTTIALTADRDSPLAELADITLRAPAIDTAAAQELHMLLTHLLCDIVETELSGDQEGYA